MKPIKLKKNGKVGSFYTEVFLDSRLILAMPSPAKPEPNSSKVPGSGTEVPPPPPVVVHPAKPLQPDRRRMLEPPVETWFSIFEAGPCPANVS
jgi:hypothetical protein